MEENNIFGDNVKLPSLPGLQSDCEEEIINLMREVDEEFQQKHNELLSELKKVRLQCHAQREEIENIKCLLGPNEENSAVRAHSLQAQKLPENALQLNSLKRSLSLQQDENKALKDRLLRVNEQYESLRGSYERLMNALTTNKQTSDRSRKSNIDDPYSNLIEEQVALTAEKFISEETKFCDEFQLKINREIADLEKRLRNEIN